MGAVGRATVPLASVDLGAQPSGGRFRAPDDPPDLRLPLRLGSCSSCGLAQLVDPSPPEADEPDAPSPLSSATMSAARAAIRGRSRRREVSRARTARDPVAGQPWRSPGAVPRRARRPPPSSSSRRREPANLRLAGCGWSAGARRRVAPGSTPGPVRPRRGLVPARPPRAAAPRAPAAWPALLAPGGRLVLEFDHLLATVEGGQWDADPPWPPDVSRARLARRRGRAGGLSWSSTRSRSRSTAARCGSSPRRRGGRSAGRRRSRARGGRRQSIVPRGSRRLRDAVERRAATSSDHLPSAQAAGRRWWATGHRPDRSRSSTRWDRARAAPVRRRPCAGQAGSDDPRRADPDPRPGGARARTPRRDPGARLGPGREVRALAPAAGARLARGSSSRSRRLEDIAPAPGPDGDDSQPAGRRTMKRQCAPSRRHPEIG